MITPERLIQKTKVFLLDLDGTLYLGETPIGRVQETLALLRAAGKKLGGAVKRNRAKRVITAAFRDCAPYIKPNYDFIIVARTRILNIKSTAAAESMLKLFREAGILKTDEKTVNRAD